MKLDLRKFKKVGGDKHHTVMQHEDGHEIKIAHKALSPKMRGQLAELPSAQDPTQQHLVPGDKIPNKIEKGIVNRTKSMMMADGGGIPGGSGSPYMDKEKAKKSDEDYAAHPHESLSDMVNNVKHAFDPVPEPKPTNQPKNYADGGQVNKPSGPPEIKKKDAEDFSKGFNNPDPIVRKAKEFFGMADGGDVPQSTPEPSPEPNPVPNEAPSIPQAPAAQPPVVVNVNGASPQQQMPVAQPSSAPPQQAPAQQQPQGIAPQAQAPQQQSDPFGTQTQSEAAYRGLNEQRAGIQGMANAQAQQGQAEAGALQNQIQQQLDARKVYQDHYQNLDNERQAFQQDLQNSHIDPNHYMESRGTLQKITNGIGLILGGMGAGILGNENPMIRYMNDQISRDIDAQKAEMGKKNTLLEANMHQFGNLRDATDMTRVMSNDIVTNRLKLAASQAATPLAKANALQAVGKLDMDSSALLGQMAMRRSLLTGMKAGQIDPAKVVNLMIPENQRQAANKELIDAQNMARARDNVLSAFDKLSQINTIGNRMTSPLQSRKQVSAIKDPIVAGLSKETAGRYTETDAKMLDSLFPAPGDNAETIATKRSQAIKLLTEKMHFPILDTYGIRMGDSGRFNNSGQGRIQESAPVIK